MNAPRHILVLRFSSMGDVAMCVPVLRQLLDQHPDVQVTFVSDQKYAPFFQGMARVRFHGAETKSRHRGLLGLSLLFREIMAAGRPDAVADLHGVLRTRILRIFFIASGIPFASIDKGRSDKEALTRKNGKVMRQLSSSFERYATVFSLLSLQVVLRMDSTFQKSPAHIAQRTLQLGIAPFARHPEKAYPPELMRQVIMAILERGDVEIFLFGGGRAEEAIIGEWVREMPALRNCATGMSLEEQLLQIQTLDLMVSMDSANMHMASMFGVPVVSVWGATHPFAGFMGWGQSAEDAVQLPLDCRPCSVFGNRPCYKGTRECLQSITPDMVLKKVYHRLGG